MASWQAGAGSAPIPVAAGVALEGYAARTAASTHVLDPLQASAVALAVDGGPPVVVVVAADVVAVDRGLRADVSDAAGLEQAGLVLCATHTHSGPAGVTDACAPSGTPPDAATRAVVADACARAARSAVASLEPAELRFARADSRGVVASRVDPRGVRDRRVSAVAARRPDGSPLATLLLVPCHPTVLGPTSTAISADLAGSVRAALAGAGPVTVVTGAAADQSTRFTRRAQDGAELARLGRRLGAAAQLALAGAATRVEPLLDVAHASVDLPRAALPDDCELRALVRSLGVSESCTLTAWRLGATAWLFAPAELSVAIGQRIESESPFAETVVVGYAGGYVGYVVDRPLHDRGTYESRVSPFAPEAADVVAAAARELLERLA